MTEKTPTHWDEETSKQFLDYGRYFITERERQMQIMLDMLRNITQPVSILELCCGEGLLAETLLEGLPEAIYLGLDGSALMLEQARRKLISFGERVTLAGFELTDPSWRKPNRPIGAVVSSLAIHHLDALGKKQLFRDIYALLSARGVFIIADMIEPATPQGRNVAADAWDEAVRQRSLELDGTTSGLQFFLREGWNTYRFSDPDDIDHPSRLFDQLKWLEEAGFVDIDVHFLRAGHALFSGWKRAG